MLDALVRLNQDARTLEQFGITVPADIAELIRTVKALQGIGHEPSPDVSLVERIITGKIKSDQVAKVTLAEVSKYEAGKQVAQTARHIAERVARTAVRAVREHLDDYLAEYRPRFTDAAAVVQELADLGVKPADDAAAVLQLGGNIAASYARLHDATATLNGARSLIALVHQEAGAEWFVRAGDVTRGVSTPIDTMHGGPGVYVRTDLDRAEGLSWLGLAAEGFQIVLNDTSGAQSVRQKATDIVARTPLTGLVRR